jgi:proteasome assembly chaperone 4
MSSSSPITVSTHAVARADASQPALAVQLTRLTGSYMLWAGLAPDPAVPGALARDWACAMPSTNVCPARDVRAAR